MFKDMFENGKYACHILGGTADSVLFPWCSFQEKEDSLFFGWNRCAMWQSVSIFFKYSSHNGLFSFCTSCTWHYETSSRFFKSPILKYTRWFQLRLLMFISSSNIGFNCTKRASDLFGYKGLALPKSYLSRQKIPLFLHGPAKLQLPYSLSKFRGLESLQNNALYKTQCR